MTSKQTTCFYLTTYQKLRWTEGRHSEELFWAGILDAIPISEEYSDLRVLFSEQSVDTLDSGIQESLMVNS
jgi:hypothetical protein